MLLLINVDDISGETMPYLIEELMARGANSVHVVQAVTKKGRLEFLFFVDTSEQRVDALAGFLASETGTLGVRVFEPRHIRFAYRFCTVRLVLGPAGASMPLIPVKQVIDENGVVISLKAEQDALRRAVTRIKTAGVDVSLPALKRLVEQAAAGNAPCSLGDLSAKLEEEVL